MFFMISLDQAVLTQVMIGEYVFVDTCALPTKLGTGHVFPNRVSFFGRTSVNSILEQSNNVIVTDRSSCDAESESMVCRELQARARFVLCLR